MTERVMMQQEFRTYRGAVSFRPTDLMPPAHAGPSSRERMTRYRAKNSRLASAQAVLACCVHRL